MRERQPMLPVWFFIGLLLAIYGVIILVAGISDWTHSPSVILGRYHPSVWGGILLLLIGGFYVLRFRPRRSRCQDARDPQ